MGCACCCWAQVLPAKAASAALSLSSEVLMVLDGIDDGGEGGELEFVCGVVG